MKANHVKLYGNGAYGVRVWEIWNEENTIHIIGNGTEYTETVTEAKGGKTLEQQVVLRMQARIRNKLASGFKHTREELGDTNTNQLGFVMPMLAQHSKDQRAINFNDCFVQPKLDGHRCLVNSSDAYTRGGKIIDTIPEIQDELSVPEGVTLDGELYYHGVPLQTVASWAKRRQPDTLKLQLHVYDIIIEGVPYRERLRMLQEMVPETQFTTLVPTFRFNPEFTPGHYWRMMRDNDYEGAILRPGSGLYEPGKRSKSLLKVKKRFDDEFECVDVIPDKVGHGKLIIKTARGQEFKTVAPGDHYQKRQTLENKEQYIGRFVTCEYAELSLDGIPQHCVAIRWRKDI